MSQQYKVGKHATTIRKSENYLAVRYHATDIVKADDEDIVLDHGGWCTPTTKTRLNQASNQFDLGYHVYQKDGDWFVEYKGKVFAWIEQTFRIKR